MWKLLAILAILTGVAICWPSWEDKPLEVPRDIHPAGAVRSVDSPTPMAGMPPVVAPEEYAPDVEHYWMQPWYLLIGCSVAGCIFLGIYVAQRDGWLG